MKTKDFECEHCGAEGIIKFVGDFSSSDVAYCPFCSADINDGIIEDDYDDDEIRMTGID